MMTEYRWMDEFSRNLKSLMAESNMSQRQLAQESGISEGMISRYLNKKCMPSVNALINLAYVFPLANVEEFLCCYERIELRPSRRW